MKQFTKEQAIAYYDAQEWKKLSDHERAAFQLTQPLLCMPFPEFHRALESALSRPVWTHEFADPDRLLKELLGLTPKPSQAEIFSLIPEEKRLIVKL